MISGFEDFTYELTEEERGVFLPRLVEHLDLVKKQGNTGPSHSMTNKDLAVAIGLPDTGSGPRMRKLIHAVRVERLVTALCSGASGYYLAENLQQLEYCLLSIRQRIRSIAEVASALAEDCEAFAQKGLFDEP